MRLSGAQVECSGRWTALRLAAAERQLRSLRPPPGELQFNLSGVERIDTAGAWLLHRTRVRLQQRGNSVSFSGQGRETDELLQLAAEQGCEPGNCEGVGGDTSWGARTHPQYTLPAGEYRYRYRLRPFSATDPPPMTLSKERF